MTTFIERHFSLSVSRYEGLWQLSFMHPENREEAMTVYVIAPNSDYQADEYRDKPIVKAGPRLTDVLGHLLYQIEGYPYIWDLAGKKLVTYGYDFESDFNGSTLSTIDLTELAFKEVNEYFHFFSPLTMDQVEEGEKVSGKGVMTKVQITLNQPRQVNHLTMDFFTEYPMTLVSLMYQTEPNGPVYEMPLAKAVQTNHSFYLHFPAVYAKIFTLILQQETYTLLHQTQSEQEQTAEQTWQYATAQSQTLYGKLIEDYFTSLIPTEPGIRLHEDILKSYQPISLPVVPRDTSEYNTYTDPFDQAKKYLDPEQS